MVKKEMTYMSFNGEEIKETFYFNLTKAELIELEMESFGLAEMMDRIVKAKDRASIIKVFKELLKKSYGEKSPDGKRFIKTPELFEAFSQTNAYSDLFMELGTNADEAIAFVNGILPSDMKMSDADIAKIKSEME